MAAAVRILLVLALLCPQEREAAREEYLGREIAPTMHWSGAEWLMRETREDEEKPALLLANLHLEPGMVVCDFGCGSGYYTLPIARAVGSEGKVLAVDLQPEMLDMVRERTREADLANVEPLLASATDPGLPPESCDLVLMVDVYHELDRPVTVLRSVRAALRKDGVLVLAEFRAEDPDVPIKPRHKMTKAQVVLEMAANGLAFEREFDGLPWQHLMAFGVDADFPREEGQAEAVGDAVARGLARAFDACDALSIGGYLAEEVALDGELRPRTDALTAIRELCSDAPLEVRTGAATDRPGDRELRIRSGDRELRFFLRSDSVGRWLAVALR